MNENDLNNNEATKNNSSSHMSFFEPTANENVTADVTKDSKEYFKTEEQVEKINQEAEEQKVDSYLNGGDEEPRSIKPLLTGILFIVVMLALVFGFIYWNENIRVDTYDGDTVIEETTTIVTK